MERFSVPAVLGAYPELVAIRELPNVIFVHCANLNKDMPGQIRRILSFLEIPIHEARGNRILGHCSFDQIKKTRAEVFINQGVNGRWRDLLAESECREYEELAVA